tara:strand:- start:11112 stop:11330 length:219 start_codon:yes stop_codon:yes gene_type:complete
LNTFIFFIHKIYNLRPQRSGLFKITKAAITPGTQPQTVRIKTINIDPQPWSMTANGGKIIDNNTRKKLMDMV